MEKYNEEYIKEHLITISNMAELHGISRQTLIYYDKTDLFKPAYKSESGYRYYDPNQIPRLRIICFLKNLGFALEDINDYLMDHNPESTFALWQAEEEKIRKKMNELETKLHYIKERKKVYQDISTKMKNVNQPYFVFRGSMSVIYKPFEKDHVDKSTLHQTLMKAWRELRDYDMMPANGFGTVVGYDEATGKVEPKGTMVTVPYPEKVKSADMVTLETGEYITMYKWGMPYNMEPTYEFVRKVHELGYEIDGDIWDMCILDSLYHDEERREDFCELIAKVKPLGK